MKHTPGPWYWNRTEYLSGAIEGADGTEIVFPAGSSLAHYEGNREEYEADMALITAAPIGLELANAVIRWWKKHQYDTEGAYGEYNTYDETPDFVKLAEAFAAEAKGEA